MYKMIDFTHIKCLIIASPGFVNEQFYKHLQEVTQNEADKMLRKNLEKIVLVKSSTGYLNSLNEVLMDEKVMVRMENTKAL
jgi:protein pelota